MFTPRWEEERIDGLCKAASIPKGFPFTTKEADDERRSKKSIRQFRSLTQVCRMIRNEYLPLYKSMITYRICHVDLQDYLDMVLLPECLRNGQQLVPIPSEDCINTKDYYDEVRRQESAQHGRIARTLLIDCKSWEERNGQPRHLSQGRRNSTVDILPFLKFCATAPGIQVQCGFNACKCCEHNWAGIRDHLNTLFAIHRYPKLRAWLEESVDAVKLRWPPSLNFVMKKGHGKRWMGEWFNSLTECPEMRAWKNEVGLNWDWNTIDSIDFFCVQADWGLTWGIHEKDEQSAEDKDFWEHVKKRNGGNKRKRREKGSCGKARLERIGRGNGRRK